jgi:hypothetical protein
MTIKSHRAAALTLFATLGAMGNLALAQAHQEQARVVSSTPAPDGGFNVTYEYAGKRYTTRTDAPPGRTLPIQISALGVTTLPVYQSNFSPDPAPGGPKSWADVVPEPGVVVSGGGQEPVYAPQPQYMEPAYAAPVYVQPAYPYPYYAAPLGISLNLGYARGWGRGGGWHRGWR